MKKTKLLTSLAALALVLGLGACNEAEDNSTLEDEESATTTETESGDGETSGSGNDGDGEGGNTGDTGEGGESGDGSGGEGYDGDPVQDILEAVQEECNYTLLIEYDEYWSDNYEGQDDALANYNENHQDLYAALYCTEDAILILYYENDDDLEGLWDMEMYVNDYDEEETYYYEGDDEDDKELTINGKETLSGAWQDNFYWLADLAECADGITKGDGTSEIAYTFDFNDYEFIEALVGALFQCANYWPDYYSDGADNLTDLLSDGEEVEYFSIYYTETETWTTKFHTGVQIYPGKGSKYYAEDDTLVASVYNVGSTVISDEYTLIKS